jgi:hypothetical protein
MMQTTKKKIGKQKRKEELFRKKHVLRSVSHSTTHKKHTAERRGEHGGQPNFLNVHKRMVSVVTRYV